MQSSGSPLHVVMISFGATALISMGILFSAGYDTLKVDELGPAGMTESAFGAKMVMTEST